MLCKILKYDLVQGFKPVFLKMLLVAILAVGSCIMCDLMYHSFLPQLGDFSGDTGTQATLSFADYTLFLIAGIEKFTPSPTTSFDIPILWMSFFLLVLYSTLGYPLSDLEGFGANVMMHAGSRRNWWVSKCLWVSFVVILDFIITYFCIAFYALLKTRSLSLNINSSMQYLLRQTLGDITHLSGQFILIVLLLPLLVAIALALMQLTISLLTKPILAFMAIGTLLLLSAYFQSPFIIGNYLMPIRSDKSISDGMNTGVGIVYSILLILGSVFIGLKAFKKYCIVSRGLDIE